jgi:hypothetical protein
MTLTARRERKDYTRAALIDVSESAAEAGNRNRRDKRTETGFAGFG